MQDWTGVAGKRVIVTGATGGIGLAAACELARRGARLSIVARSESRATAAVARIKAAGGTGTEVEVHKADLSSQASIRRLAAEILSGHPKVDVLINNAGAIYASRQLTEDGLELTWAVNHLAPFLLTNLLLDRIRASAPARIVTTSSGAHHGARIPFDDINGDRGSRGFARYGQTKLANILFTVELARRLEGSGVTANCFHPGFVASGFNKNNGRFMAFGMTLARPFARSPEKGADTLVWLADSPEVSSQTGGYFADRKRKQPSEAARDTAAARRLWELSEAQTHAGASG
ncbi:MAG: SDR family oxidoreductase [Candidatus Dormibacteria bacterium]|jgi:NAD(P)-dependent dehydrogenase (short-subunit alcohol dehydrogenase family)